jgi:hypothetical protein
MTYARWKLARFVHDLATWTEPSWLNRPVEPHPRHPDEKRLEAVLGRHIYGLDRHLTDEDEEIREPLEAIVNHWIKVRQDRSTYRSRVRAAAIGTELCNLSARFPPK